MRADSDLCLIESINKTTKSHERRNNGEQTLQGEVFFSLLSWRVQ